MIKKEYYVISVIVMVVALIMFQSLGIATSIFQEEDINVYAQQTSLSSNSAKKAYAVEEKAEVAVYDRGHAWLEEWLINNKKTYHIYTQTEEFVKSEAALMIVNPDDLKLQDYAVLYEALTSGKVMVFTKLPDVKYLENEQVKKVLGIKSYKGMKDIEFIKLYDGFFIGQETHYQEDVKLRVPYVSLQSGYKVFMDGYLEKETANIKNEEMPPLVWRSYVKEGFVYVMNNDFMEDSILGMGFLTGICNDYQPYTIYPVVNAKSMVLVNFPMISNENEEALMRRYSRSSISLMRDVVYPQLISILEEIGCKGTFLFSSRLDYDIRKPIDEDALAFYMEHLNKEGAEMGLSGIQISDLPLQTKLKQDIQVFKSLYPKYDFRVFAADQEDDDDLRRLMSAPATSSVRTFFVPDGSRNRLFDYLNSYGLYIQSNWDMKEYSYKSDLRLKSLFTSLGMLNMTVDMKNLIYPESDQDDWTVLSKDMSRYGATYLHPYLDFDSTLLSEADERIRQFMALDYHQERKGNVIHVSIENLEKDAYFLLNLHDEEVEECENGDFVEVDDGVYLLHAKKAEMNVTLKEAT